MSKRLWQLPIMKCRCDKRALRMLKLFPLLILLNVFPLVLVLWPSTFRALQNVPVTYEKFAWVTSTYGGDPGYQSMLLALVHSIRANGGHEPILVLDMGKTETGFKKELEKLGCDFKYVDKVQVPPKTAQTLDEPRHLPNFIRLRMWNFTEYDRLAYVDADMLFIRDVNAVRKLPCVSGVPQKLGTVNGGLIVLCPSQKIANAMIDKLNRDDGVYPMAEQTFLSYFFWGKWHYASTCLNARASWYRATVSGYFKTLRMFIHRHLFFWPWRDTCKLEDVVVLHFLSSKKPWMSDASSWYAPEILEIFWRAAKEYNITFPETPAGSYDLSKPAVTK